MVAAGYPSDLSDEEWALIEPHMPAAKRGGRPRTSNLRRVVDAILYLLRTGCQWRLPPKDFPPWENDWLAFLGKWVPAITGVPFDPEKHKYFGGDYRHYIAITKEVALVSDPFHQSIDDFVKCQHSRDTFALSKLGERVGQFDAELAELLIPHASDGVLSFRVKTTLMWSTILKAD